MNTTLEKRLGNYFERKNILSRVELIGAIQKDHPAWTQSTITVYMSKLKKAGKLGSPSRGIYTLSTKKDFEPALTQQIKRIYNKVHKEYPYVNCCIWSTTWLNDLMRHQPFKQFIVVEIEKDAISQAFNVINDSHRNVFMNPDTNMFDHYIVNADEAVIIKPLVSEAPLEQNLKTVIPSLEKLLVDMLIDKDLFAAQQGEITDIYENAFKRYTINISKMRRYAVRRNREREVTKLINLTSAQ